MISAEHEALMIIIALSLTMMAQRNPALEMPALHCTMVGAMLTEVLG